ncbi:MAG TPA: hypothetical protein VHD56_07265 [Tepidisphaeraceae bacterium]|nr:hypothetical protein [Tepidisphaeraceae bacterium]
MTTQELDQKSEERKSDWINRVARLIEEVEQWAAAERWVSERDHKQIHEDLIGDYVVPGLRIRTPGGDIFVNPIALHIVGADGRIDIEAWPTLNRVKLLGRPGGWQIMTDSNVPLPQKWGRETFTQLVRDLHA